MSEALSDPSADGQAIRRRPVDGSVRDR